MLGIVYSGDWLSFIKEALNLRTTFTTYRLLYSFLTTVDNEACERGKSEESTIDQDFRSGVLLGAGMSNVILSLLPHRLLSVVELFGFKGNRKEGLEMLYRAGGWREASDPDAAVPKVSKEEEGVRRSIIDMALLIFHLALSSFTSDGIDIPRATNILRWNSARYPRGIFFLFGQGRLHLLRGQPREAIRFYTAALSTQSQYRNMNQVRFVCCILPLHLLWVLTDPCQLLGDRDCEPGALGSGGQRTVLEKAVGGGKLEQSVLRVRYRRMLAGKRRRREGERSCRLVSEATERPPADCRQVCSHGGQFFSFILSFAVLTN